MLSEGHTYRFQEMKGKDGKGRASKDAQPKRGRNLADGHPSKPALEQGGRRKSEWLIRDGAETFKLSHIGQDGHKGLGVVPQNRVKGSLEQQKTGPGAWKNVKSAEKKRWRWRV
jgi:hypothetical protein